ncbi:MAG: ribosome assembly RNA-binding protein YhbY [Firmicutes bacterium]|nr:ribosome assembly RNA-binding protein YhbY [Bacillota bacterium]
MTPKQRAYLRSLAQKENAIFQIGKSGVSPEFIQSADDALEKRELIKISVLNNCEEELSAAAEKTASRTHSEVVQIIGRKFVLYRASKKPHIELPKA